MENLDLLLIRHRKNTTAEKIAPYVIPFCDLTIVLKGELEYRVNDVPVTVSAGDAVLCKSGCVRERVQSKAGVDYFSFNFYIDGELPLPTVLRNCLTSEVKLIIAACDEIHTKTYLNNEHKIEHLLSCLLLIFQSQLATKDFKPVTAQIIKYIHENLASKITLQEIGKLTFFSPVYCDTLFKKETGKSIIDYILDERINEAKKLLLEGLPLKQIAESVGFSDYNYFARVFKKRTGYTPTRYHESLLKRSTP